MITDTTTQLDDMMLRMRALSEKLDAPTDGVRPADASGFGEFLTQSLAAVNERQQVSGEMAKSFTLGEDVSVAEVMVAAQQASLSFEAMNQVRGRLISAYREIMSMQL